MPMSRSRRRRRRNQMMRRRRSLKRRKRMSREVHRKTEESKVSVQCIDEDEFIASVEPSLCSEPGHADVNAFVR